MKKQSYFTKALVIALCLVCVTALAGSSFKTIRKASMNSDYTYTLDGNPIMEGEPIILYQDVYYAPVASVAASLGYDTTVDGEKAAFTTPNTKPTVPTKPTAPTTPTTPSTTNTTIEKAVITAIDFASNTVTVYPEGQSDAISNQIQLKVTGSTEITGTNGSKLAITNLNPNMVIKVTYGPTTKSIPAQADAIKIVAPTTATPIQPR